MPQAGGKHLLALCQLGAKGVVRQQAIFRGVIEGLAKSLGRVAARRFWHLVVSLDLAVLLRKREQLILEAAVCDIDEALDDGCVVLVSGAPARNCKPGQISLSSVGGAVEAFARAIAKEIAPKRINVMSPGTIDTPMVGLQGEERKAFYEKVVADNPITRAGTPDECGQAIMFLIENDFVTGTTIDVDGGWILS